MINVYQPRFLGNETAYVNECLSSTWISSRGRFIDTFEERFAAYVASPYATTVANGTVALHLALLALGIGQGDEVILPTFTYVASANAILYNQATPVFVDSLADSWQMDPDQVRRSITPKTKAIMAVHLYGHPCNMDELVAIAKEHNLYLIEDCAEALGSFYKGQHVGTFGDVGTFSFYGNKTITTGEGGMVIMRDPALLQRCRQLKSQGVSSNKQYWHDILAYNYRMTNIAAAIGLAQLEQIEKILEDKRQIAAWYRADLAGLPVQFHEPVGDVTHSYWMCSILLHEQINRDTVRQQLAEAGIETRPLFYPVHSMPMYSKNNNEHHPVAEDLGRRGMNLPSWPGLAREEIAFIVQVLAKALNGAA